MLPPHWFQVGDLPSSRVTAPSCQSETALYCSVRPVTVMALLSWGCMHPAAFWAVQCMFLYSPCRCLPQELAWLPTTLSGTSLGPAAHLASFPLLPTQPAPGAGMGRTGQT